MLLSSGGNDLISGRKPGRGEPHLPRRLRLGERADYIDEVKLGETLNEVAGLLGAIARDVRRLRRDLPITTHAYDWIELRNYPGFPGSPGE